MHVLVLSHNIIFHGLLFDLHRGGGTVGKSVAAQAEGLVIESQPRQI